MQPPTQDPLDPLRDDDLQWIQPPQPPPGGVEYTLFNPAPADAKALEAAGALQQTPTDGWSAWGTKEFGSSDVGEYVGKLAKEQRELLRVALLHALGPGHGGQISFRKRVTEYTGGWGLEVIDGTVIEPPHENTILPLVIVFVEPPYP